MSESSQPHDQASGKLRPLRVVGSLSSLPDNVIGAANLNVWGVVAFMMIEGMGFALCGAAALYLASQGKGWPPSGTAPPDLSFGIAFTILLLASEVLNRWVDRKAWAHDLAGLRLGMVLITAVGVVLIGVRALELMHLNVRWSDNAYGSTIWLLMVLHTSHLITDVADTAVQTEWLFRKEIEDKQFSGASDNCLYWDFVVLTWLPIWGLVYWMPRFWGGS
ncbi:cytochrome c oxidase subunit 3 [Sabulicella rubraurantiaca]|uniref:cytochrome c oxidase subunit 3 n=1 Tax=Sabulicella rubraurantiaca TaxID=2811429 RepID=UPI001A9701C7|nr:cytochrome c oxidase subunit 3 [Sabulicella rubraurantiaca]